MPSWRRRPSDPTSHGLREVRFDRRSIKPRTQQEACCVGQRSKGKVRIEVEVEAPSNGRSGSPNDGQGNELRAKTRAGLARSRRAARSRARLRALLRDVDLLRARERVSRTRAARRKGGEWWRRCAPPRTRCRLFSRSCTGPRRSRRSCRRTRCRRPRPWPCRSSSRGARTSRGPAGNEGSHAGARPRRKTPGRHVEDLANLLLDAPEGVRLLHVQKDGRIFPLDANVPRRGARVGRPKQRRRPRHGGRLTSAASTSRRPDDATTRAEARPAAAGCTLATAVEVSSR